jgi:hypothetical protein
VPLSSCGSRQSGGAPDSPVPLLLAALTSAAHCAALFTMSESTVARLLTGQSGGTPDSPVNYSGARLRFPESGCLEPVRPWCPGHSPVHQTTSHSSPFAPLNLCP